MTRRPSFLFLTLLPYSAATEAGVLQGTFLCGSVSGLFTLEFSLRYEGTGWISMSCFYGGSSAVATGGLCLVIRERRLLSRSRCSACAVLSFLGQTVISVAAATAPWMGALCGGCTQPLGSPGLCRHQPLSRSLQTLQGVSAAKKAVANHNVKCTKAPCRSQSFSRATGQGPGLLRRLELRRAQC
ncbi:unnamed protein product [Caretta caretta]